MRAGRAASPKGLLAPNRVDPQHRRPALTKAALAEMAERWAPAVRQHADHVEAVGAGEWIGQYAPDSPATRDIQALADALEGLLGVERRPSGEAAPAAHVTLIR